MPISSITLQQIASNDPLLDKLHLRPESGISDDDMKFLVEAALSNQNRYLKSIIVTNNDLSDIGVLELAKLQHVEFLALDANDIGDTGAIALAQMHNLKTLGLGGNEVSDIGAKALAESNLSSLHLWDNNLTEQCSEYFLKNTTLIEISLNGNNISPQTILKIKEHVSNNKARIESESITPIKELALNSQNNQNTLFGKSNQQFNENSNNGVSPDEQAIINNFSKLPEIRKIYLVEGLIKNNNLADKINLNSTRSLVK